MTPHTHRERVDGCFRCDLAAGEPVDLMAALVESLETAQRDRTEREEESGEHD